MVGLNLSMSTNTPSKEYWEKINLFSRQSSFLQEKIFRSPISYIFNGITDRFFKPDSQKKVLEIGCAPGHKLIAFAKRYGYAPYGVDYSASGVKAAREGFLKVNFPLENVFFADFFSENFQNAHQKEFDVVMSFGFIEHFKEVEEAVVAHLNLLKTDGLLLIMIPNLRGIYCPLLQFFAPHLLDLHNLSLMEYSTFAGVFKEKKLEPLFCNYYGLINFGLLQAQGKIRQCLLKILWRVQSLFNPLFSLIYRPALENRFTSPYLIFIGRKQ